MDFGAGAPRFAGASVSVRWQDHEGELAELKSERSRRDGAAGAGDGRGAVGGSGPTGPATGACSRRRAAGRCRATTCATGCWLPARAAGRAPVGVVPHVPPHVRSLAFAAGRNVAQVSAWLGHTDPSFTLRTYVHLMDDGPGDAGFMDAATASRFSASPA